MFPNSHSCQMLTLPQAVTLDRGISEYLSKDEKCCYRMKT